MNEDDKIRLRENTEEQEPSFYDPEAEKIKVLITDPVFEYSRNNQTGEKVLKRGELPRENKEEFWGTTGSNFKLQNTDGIDRRVIQCRIRARHLNHRIWAKRNTITPEWIMRQEEQKIYDLAALNRTKDGETNRYVTSQRIHNIYEETSTMLNSGLSKLKEGVRRL